MLKFWIDPWLLGPYSAREWIVPVSRSEYCHDSMLTLTSYSGLTPEQVERLWRKHIYLPSTGRINVAGLNPMSLPVVAAAIDEVVREDS